MTWLPILPRPLYADRREGGRGLASLLEDERGPGLVVVGLARGGVATAAEVAGALGAPLDVVAVRKVRHPWQPEYGIGAVTPGGGVYLRGGGDGLTERELDELVGSTREEAAALDRHLHEEVPPLELRGRTVIVVDDGIATAATMIAALRAVRAAGAGRVVAAAPVAPSESLRLLEDEADAVVCCRAPEPFLAVGIWYASFPQLRDSDVIALLVENRRGLPYPPVDSPSLQEA